MQFTKINLEKSHPPKKKKGESQKAEAEKKIMYKIRRLDVRMKFRGYMNTM